MRHRADQRRLLVVAARAPDTSPCGGGGGSAIAGHQYRSRHLAPVGQPDRHRGRPRRMPGHRRFHPDDARLALDRRQQRRPQVAVLDHEAHRAFLDLGMVEAQRQRRGPLARPSVRYPDAEDRLHLPGKPRPDPRRGEQPLRRNRQCIGAPVETGTRLTHRRHRVGQDRAQAGLCQRQGQRRAVQPAAGDEDIRFHADGLWRPGRDCPCAGALLAGRVPGTDARVLQNATAAVPAEDPPDRTGVLGPRPEPSHRSPPCVNDEDAAAGGSSSGAAASVAFRLAGAGIGSDTCGSVRIVGLCAWTVPTGTASAGVSLWTAPFAEARLLRPGTAAERALARVPCGGPHSAMWWGHRRRAT
jgi:hypothetical protein